MNVNTSKLVVGTTPAGGFVIELQSDALIQIRDRISTVLEEHGHEPSDVGNISRAVEEALGL